MGSDINLGLPLWVVVAHPSTPSSIFFAKMLPIESPPLYPPSSSFHMWQDSVNDVFSPLELTRTQPSTRLVVMVLIFCVSLFGTSLSLRVAFVAPLI